MVCIYFAEISITSNHLGVNNRWDGFSPRINAETNTVKFFSSILFIHLFLNNKGFTWTLKFLFLRGVWVSNTLAFWLLQEQCSNWNIFLNGNKALHHALFYWGSPKFSIIFLECWIFIRFLEVITVFRMSHLDWWSYSWRKLTGIKSPRRAFKFI